MTSLFINSLPLSSTTHKSSFACPFHQRRSLQLQPHTKHVTRPLSLPVPRAVLDAPSPTPARAAHVVAPVVDTRSGMQLTEVHHFLYVDAAHLGPFERAAMGHSHTVSALERRRGSRAQKRWLLRQLRSGGSPPAPAVAALVAMERFGPAHMVEQAGPCGPTTERWLSGVKRVGRGVGLVDVHSKGFECLFTASLYNAREQWHQEGVIVVTEAINAKGSASGEELSRLVDILQSGAEAAVAVGDCLEFSILQARDDPSYFKTVEVYPSLDKMQSHMKGLDKAFVLRSQGRIQQGSRVRQMYKPLLFS